MEQDGLRPRAAQILVNRYNCISNGIKCRLLVTNGHSHARCAFGQAATGEIPVERLADESPETIEPQLIGTCVNKIKTADQATTLAIAILKKYSN